MRRTDDDLLDIPIERLDTLDQDELLRIVVISRDSDETEPKQRAKAAWTALVTGDMDRVRGLVATFRSPKMPGVTVARDDVDPVAQDAWLRLVQKVFPNFRGTAIGQFRAAMRTCVHYQCMDHCRRQMHEDMHRQGSLDEPIETKDGEARGRFDDAVFKQELERLEDAASIARAAERREAVRAAISSIDDDRKRRVLEMTQEGRSAEEIAGELDTSVDNVYQLRKRGMTLLKELLDDEGKDQDGDR